MPAVRAALERGAAALWMTDEREVWEHAGLAAADGYAMREGKIVAIRRDTP